jgi:hypothetical protein
LKVLDDDDDKVFEPTSLGTFESIVVRNCAMSLKHSMWHWLSKRLYD